MISTTGNNRHCGTRPAASRIRRAFTLVEMLVAVTLVLLMMTLFGEIFGLATSSMDLQRAIAENDQQIRTLTTVLRSDLQKRTFRNVVPYYPLESQDDASMPFSDREGYFYISLNSSLNAVDNVLQFTVHSKVVEELADDSPYYGRAARLPGNFLTSQNQPDHDDGEITPNGAGSSPAAEICYFVRGGNLYRRQLLLRSPLAATGADDSQPTRADGADYFAPASGPAYASTQFWEDFDYSSVIRFNGGQAGGAGFVGAESLSNETALSPHASPLTGMQIPLHGITPLGQPRHRFGFDPFTGLSREFGDTSGKSPGDGSGTFFIGRFTQAETSSADFTYPHIYPGSPTPVGNGNPMDSSGTPLTDAGDGSVSQYPAGSRIGEDLLLTSVHEFQIEVWDERAGRFVEIGYGNPSTDPPATWGDYHAGRRLGVPGVDTRATASLYAPVGGTGAVLDTWHPFFDYDNADNQFDDLNNSDGSGPDNPPFRPMTLDPTGVSAPLPVNAGPGAFWDHSPLLSTPGPGTTYNIGDAVFPPTEDQDVDGIMDAGENGSLPAAVVTNTAGLDTSGPAAAHGRLYYYICLQNGSDPANPVPSTSQPPWSSSPGQLLRTADGYVWQVRSNLRPLKAIRLTVRFLHRRSGKMRQMTLVQPMLP